MTTAMTDDNDGNDGNDGNDDKKLEAGSTSITQTRRQGGEGPHA